MVFLIHTELRCTVNHTSDLHSFMAFCCTIKYTEMLPYLHKCVQNYWHRSSTDECCNFVNNIHGHEMNEFANKTNMNTGVDRLISWFSCWCSPQVGVMCCYDQYWSSPDKRKLSGHRASIYFSSSSNIRRHEWQGGTAACPGNLSTYQISFAPSHKMRHKAELRRFADHASQYNPSN